MRSRRFARWAPLAAALLAASHPGPGWAQRLGIFFDREGTSCSESIASFGVRDVYIVAFPGPDQQLVGAQFRLNLPPDIEISGNPPPSFPRDIGGTMVGGLTEGMDIQYFPCRDVASPIVILEFRIFARDARSDFVLELVGAAEDSLTSADKPKLKLCDPDDPDGNAGLVDVGKAQAHLNCTQTCPCTVAVARRTWGGLKSLFREP